MDRKIENKNPEKRSQKLADHFEILRSEKMTATKEATEAKEVNTMEVDQVEEDEDDGIMTEVKKMSTDEITARARLLDNEIRIMRSDMMRIQHEMQGQKDKIKENTEKIKVNKTLPYLVSNVIEILDVDPEELGIEEDGANVDLDSQRKGKFLTQHIDDEIYNF